jgi:glycosyltransferase involved in cell wall biosynthesis
VRVSIDGRMAGLPGIGRFTLELWRALVHRRADVVGLWTPRPPGWLGVPIADPPGPVRTTRLHPFGPLEQVALPAVLRHEGVDVHHATHLTVPYLARVPVVLTVHDLFPLRDRANPRSRLAGLYYRTAFPRAARRAEAVVAVSDDTAEDLERSLGVRDVRVIQHGIDLAKWEAPPAEVVQHELGSMGVTPPYLLYVGTVKRHKNLPTLLAAHHGADLPQLVLAGATPDEARSAADGVLPPHVRVLGRVSDHQLRCLYAAAVALAVPSLYEAVGLAVWEAMAAGTPVVSSDGGGLPQTVGSAGLLVPALDVAGWREALTRVTIDDALARDLVARGHDHLATRTWDAAAAAYLDVYRSVA